MIKYWESRQGEKAKDCVKVKESRREGTEMKNIFKKLHKGINHEPNMSNENPTSVTSSSRVPDQPTGSDQQSGISPASPSASSPSSVSNVSSANITTVSPATMNQPDYMSSEEEFQIQLALAISASNSEFRDDPEKHHIRAATMLSLGTHKMDTAREKNDAAAEALSRHYWVSCDELWKKELGVFCGLAFS